MTPLLLGTIGVYASAVLSTTAIAGFVTLTRFWRSQGGWFVFWDLLMISWVLDLSAVSHIFDAPWFVWLRVGTFAVGFPVVLIWRLWIIFDLQVWQRRRVLKMYGEQDSRPAGKEGKPIP